MPDGKRDEKGGEEEAKTTEEEEVTRTRTSREVVTWWSAVQENLLCDVSRATAWTHVALFRGEPVVSDV